MAKPQDTKGPDDSARGVTHDLASRIALAKRDRDIEDNRASKDASRDMTGLARGMRIGTEFIAAILVGAGIGYLIDLGLGTSPWGYAHPLHGGLRRWNTQRHPSGGGNECRIACPAGVRSRTRRGRRRAERVGCDDEQGAETWLVLILSTSSLSRTSFRCLRWAEMAPKVAASISPSPIRPCSWSSRSRSFRFT